MNTGTHSHIDTRRRHRAVLNQPARYPDMDPGPSGRLNLTTRGRGAGWYRKQQVVDLGDRVLTRGSVAVEKISADSTAGGKKHSVSFCRHPLHTKQNNHRQPSSPHDQIRWTLERDLVRRTAEDSVGEISGNSLTESSSPISAVYIPACPHEETNPKIPGWQIFLLFRYIGMDGSMNPHDRDAVFNG